jgi:hypothetical protein
VIYGLEVIVAKNNPQTIVVAPGVAIDAEGRTLMLSAPVPLKLEDEGETMVVIYFDEVPDKTSPKEGEGDKYSRIIERVQVLATKTAPKGAYLELARIDRLKPDSPITDAENPFDPKEDEIDLLHRSLSFPHCYADGVLADLCFMPVAESGNWKPNRAGLWNLIREANGCGFHLDFAGVHNMRAPVTQASPFMLYVAGETEFQALSAAQMDGLRRYLEGGGTLFAEASRGGKGFATAFRELAPKLGAKLEKADRTNTLLSTHHIFPDFPSGGSHDGQVEVDLDCGVVFSTYDYGAAWQGAVADKNGRDVVRSAQEFGLNIVTWAAKRRRLSQLSNYA